VDWLGALSLLACAVSPPDQAAPATPAVEAAVEAAVVAEVAQVPAAVALNDASPPMWDLFKEPNDPELDAVLAIIRRQAPDTPLRLQVGGVVFDDPWVPDALVAERGELEPGRWRLWWNQQRDHYEAWEVDLPRGRARRLYAGGRAGRPAWVAATENFRPTPPPGAALDAARWWERYAALAALSGTDDDTLLSLARATADPHPAVSKLAMGLLSEALRARSALPPEVAATLAAALVDPRPGMRSAAAHIVGASQVLDLAQAAVPLRCDPEPAVALAATVALLPWLGREELRPLLVDPDPLVARLAAYQWQEPPPAQPVDSQACRPEVQGRWTLALWSPALGAGPVQATLLGEDGAAVGQVEVKADTDWFAEAPVAVTAPPVRLRLAQGGVVEEQAVPMALGARVAGLCTVAGSPPATEAGFQQTSLQRREQPACVQAAVTAFQALGDEPLRKAAGGSTSNAEERDRLMRALLVAPGPELLPLAVSWLRQDRRASGCAERARLVLAADLASPELLDLVRQCRIGQDPFLLADQLAMTERTGQGLAWLNGLPKDLDPGLAVRLRVLVATHADTEPEAAYHLLAMLEGRDSASRHAAMVLPLPDGGALLGIPTPCLAEGPARTRVDGVLVLGRVAAEGLRVEHLDPEQAAVVHTVVCGAHLLWQRKPPAKVP